MSIWKKLILTTAFIGFYFLILRPIRSYTAEIIRPIVKTQNFETYNQSSVSTTIIYSSKNLTKEFPFKIPFGMFFLFSTISLIFISAGWKNFGILCLIQIFFWLIAFVSMLFGSKGNLFFLEVMDMILRYLLPLSSLGFPAYLIIQKRSNAEIDSYES
tara:strand:- start:1361 stop:1834 length:474 start_codon:yes stop_codon:yes gene_type:complete